MTEETSQGPCLFYRVGIQLTGPELKGDKAREIQRFPGLPASAESRPWSALS